jgi:trehalose 6-phosphate phosphatase
VDGTLLELASTPDSVFVPHVLMNVLSKLHERLGGALALVSGRALADLDRLFAPLCFCAAGIHGAEQRGADGHVARAEVDQAKLRDARAELTLFVQTHEGLLLEDKSCALALHFRRAPHLEEAARARMRAALDSLGGEYALQPGKYVFEIRPAAATKGTAVRAFLQQPPFAGRAPIYLGDDVTDEHAFEAVNDLGGISVRVGGHASTQARYRIPCVAEAQRWLSNWACAVATPSHQEEMSIQMHDLLAFTRSHGQCPRD